MAWRGYQPLDSGGSALPEDWASAWGAPSPFYRRQLVELRDALEQLATGLPLLDESATYSSLVTPAGNELAPVHRWYSYKEAFSHRLPKELVSRFGAGLSGVVADSFGGVATTALSLQSDPRVSRVLSVEYSPFAHAVGKAKLSWHSLRAERLRSLMSRALKYRELSSVDVPDLAAFQNREIFRPRILRALLSAKSRIDKMEMAASEHAFFLTGIASVVEDLSGAMKDGRALRILRDRQRKQKYLIPNAVVNHDNDRVRHALGCQWTAMIEDIEALATRRRRIDRTKARHLRGDARDLKSIRVLGSEAFPANSVGLFAYSPPYLNCIDYSEVYKLELWILELISTHDEFRKLRLGTLRSHPSVEFPQRDYLAAAKGTRAHDALELIAGFVERNNVRPQIGRMIWNYFDDMYQVLSQQYEALEPGGHAVCVVGNSTFSRRDKTEDGVTERWRVPVVTDIILARLAEVAGFDEVQIWKARDLRPRNAKEGSARESLVVARKA